jgi:hypothetical protein
VLYTLEVPGTSETVSTHRLVLFTGNRFLNTFTLENGAPPSKRRRRNIADPSSTGPVTRSKGAASAASRQTVSAPACPPSNGGANFADPVSGGVALLCALMRGEGPTAATLAELCALVDACRFCMADRMLNLLSTYLGPWVQSAPLVQVCKSLRTPCVQLLAAAYFAALPKRSELAMSKVALHWRGISSPIHTGPLDDVTCARLQVAELMQHCTSALVDHHAPLQSLYDLLYKRISAHVRSCCHFSEAAKDIAQGLALMLSRSTDIATSQAAYAFHSKTRNFVSAEPARGLQDTYRVLHVLLAAANCPAAADVRCSTGKYGHSTFLCVQKLLQSQSTEARVLRELYARFCAADNPSAPPRCMCRQRLLSQMLNGLAWSLDLPQPGLAGNKIFRLSKGAHARSGKPLRIVLVASLDESGRGENKFEPETELKLTACACNLCEGIQLRFKRVTRSTHPSEGIPAFVHWGVMRR